MKAYQHDVAGELRGYEESNERKVGEFRPAALQSMRQADSGHEPKGRHATRRKDWFARRSPTREQGTWEHLAWQERARCVSLVLTDTGMTHNTLLMTASNVSMCIEPPKINSEFSSQ